MGVAPFTVLDAREIYSLQQVFYIDELDARIESGSMRLRNAAVQ